MTEQKTPPDVESMWRSVLVEGHRSRFAFLPNSPRCAGCHEPFAGLGGRLMSLLGRRPSRKNPHFCNFCDDVLPIGGAEVDIGIIFADIRGSTTLAEKLGPTEFARTLNRFYHVANDILIRHDAMIDKMVGDEVMGLFIPALCKSEHRRHAANAGAELARAFKDIIVLDQQLPVGTGIHCGPAFVGKVGSSGVQDFTALGDTVNTAARLQAEAGPGEVAISEDLYLEAPDNFPGAQARAVSLRGRSAPLSIRIYSP
jgi:adenylate cyclase